MARYDTIGIDYTSTRREEPRFRERIHAALGASRTVVNVGAGAGSYEPRDRYVIAIEPSDVMAAQRPIDLAPALRGSSRSLPLRDGAVDACMSILSVHHWDEEREQGVREMRRVARGPVVIMTYDPRVNRVMWLHDYWPELNALDGAIFPHPEEIGRWLGGDIRVETVPIPRDCADWMLGSFWAHPERVLDAGARAATSGFARMPASVVERVVSDVKRDLEDGTWDRKYGALRALDECDVGLRLIIAQR